MVKIGIVGVGFMGMIHYLASRRVAGYRLWRSPRRDPKKLAGDWTSIQGNFGPRGDAVDLSEAQRRLSEMLADPDCTWSTSAAQ